MPDYTRINLSEVEDVAAKHGFGELQEARFPREALGIEQSGFGHLRVKPNQRQPFAHRHRQAEEVYIVVSGSGRAELDGETVELEARDLLRLAPGVVRRFEAGPDGLEFLVFGRRFGDDAEIVQDT